MTPYEAVLKAAEEEIARLRLASFPSLAGFTVTPLLMAEDAIRAFAETLKESQRISLDRALNPDHYPPLKESAQNDIGRAVPPHRSGGPQSPHDIVRNLFEKECQDGDKLADALGVSRTEGGFLNVPKMLAKIHKLQETAQPDRAKALEGWKLVPVEPTDAMVSLGYRQVSAGYGARDVYRAMLAAVPSACGVNEERK